MIADVIVALNENNPGYCFGFGTIMAGGIEWFDWPGRFEGEFKSLHFTNFTYWPPTPEDWDISFVVYDYFDCCSNGTITTELHTDGGAPGWSNSDVAMMKNAFLNVWTDEINKIN